MSEERQLKLWVVEVTLRMVVLAKDETEAEQIAGDLHREVWDPDYINANPVKTLKDLRKDEHGSLPYRDDENEEELTCAQILEALEKAP